MEDRPIPPHVTDAEIEAVERRLNEAVPRAVGCVRCPVHRVAPEVAFTVRRQQGVRTRARVCCPELEEIVAERVRRFLIEHPIDGWRYKGD